MVFPVYFHVLGHQVHPHEVMETTAYVAGFALFLWQRRKSKKVPAASGEQSAWMIAGAVIGALVGAKALAYVESINLLAPHWHDPRTWVGGKTIVGGLLGGWAGVEIAKKRLGILRSTGDNYVFPLIVGMAIGRVGCFLTGLEDHTCGSHTSVPWAVDFGDGPRHPAQLYDIVFLILLGAVLRLRMRRPMESGRLFRLFMMSYLAYRFGVEFLKDRFTPYGGLSAIQVTCLIASAAIAWRLYRPMLLHLRAATPGRT